MISGEPGHDDVRLAERWNRARRTLRGLPMLESGPEDLEAIFARTVDRSSRGGGWTSRSRGLAGAAAMAASLAVAATGAWTWAHHSASPSWSEAELARLDAEVEHVLVRLGQLLREPGRTAVIGAIGDPATSKTENSEVVR